MKAKSFLKLVLVYVLIFGNQSIGAEENKLGDPANRPLEETPIKLEGVDGNEPESVDLVQINDEGGQEINKDPDVLPIGIKVTFAKAEKNARKWVHKGAKRLYKADQGQIQMSEDEREKEVFVLRIKRSLLSDIERYSPTKLGNEFQKIYAKNAVESMGVRINNTVQNVSIRFPLETVVFYSVIAATSCAFSTSSLLFDGARTDLACLDTLSKQFTPLGIASFSSFVATSSIAQRALNRSIDQLTNLTLNYRSKALMNQYQNVATNKFSKSLQGRLEFTGAHAKNFAVERVKNLRQNLLGMFGMASGMLVSRYFEEIAHDDNILDCAKGLAIPNSVKQWEQNCETAYDSWFKKKRFKHLGIDMADMLVASFLGHKTLNGIKFGLKHIPGRISSVLLSGLNFNFKFGSNGPGNMKPQFEFLNRLLSPLAPSSIGNLSLFMSVDQGVVSKISARVKIDDQIRYLDTETKLINAEYDRIIKQEMSVKENAADSFFDRQLRDYYLELATLRRMRSATVTEKINNWMSATSEFLSVYQSSHILYRDFLYQAASAKQSSTIKRNPYEDTNYLNQVYSWIDRGKFAERPVKALVSDVNQPLETSNSPIPLAALLMGLGYNGNEISEFPLYSKFNTIKKGMANLMPSVIERVQAKRQNSSDSATANLILKQLANGGINNWENILQDLSKKLDPKLMDMVRVYQNLAAANYKLKPEMVLTSSEMKELNLESDLKMVSSKKKGDRLEAVEDPENREDELWFIRRADRRSVKELRFRIKHIDVGLRLLKELADKNPGDQALKTALEYIGGPGHTPAPGINFLNRLMADTDKFRPPEYEFFPKEITYSNPGESGESGGVFDLRPVDYVLLSIVCGPSSHNFRPQSKDSSLAEYLRSPLVESPMGSAMKFRPPGLTSIPNKDVRAICGTQRSARDLYNMNFEIGGRKDYGLIPLIIRYLRPEIAGFVKKHNGDDSDQLNFDIWWNSYVLPLVEGLYQKFQSEYYNIVAKDLVPLFRDLKAGVFADLYNEMLFSKKLINGVLDSKVALLKTAARSGTDPFLLVDMKSETARGISKQVDDVINSIFSIRDHLLKSAQLERLFPNGSEKANIGSLAEANREYMEKYDKILREVTLLADLLGIEVEVVPGFSINTIQVKGGAKFVNNRTKTEEQRILETAIRGLINNVNEVSQYSDMIFLLSKDIGKSSEDSK